MKRINEITAKLTSAAPKVTSLAIALGCAFAASQMAWAGVPMSTFPHKASKDGITYTSTIVGTNPFNPGSWGSGLPINAVVVPIAITIGGSKFDPTVADACDSVPAQTRFYNSPLTQKVPLTMEGVNVGNTQFINGFRRAEFWDTIGGSAAYQNTINFNFPYSKAAFTFGFPGWTTSVTNLSGCTSTVGAVAPGLMQSFLAGTIIPQLQSSGVISPTSFAIFLFRNVVQVEAVDSYGNPTTFALGFHSFVGPLANAQTYAAVDWDTVNFLGAADGSAASHEIAEWMDDPLLNNATPAWGKVGQVQVSSTNPTGCSNQWEAGDPLTGKLMPPIIVGGYPYHMQELAFFSFFFNSPIDPSVGASYFIYRQGTFSSNGTFLAPSNLCPNPGGVAPFGGKWTNFTGGTPVLIDVSIL